MPMTATTLDARTFTVTDWMRQVQDLGFTRLTVVRCSQHHQWTARGITPTGAIYAVRGAELVPTLTRFLTEYPRA